MVPAFNQPLMLTFAAGLLSLVVSVVCVPAATVWAQVPIEPLTAAAISEIKQHVRDLDSDDFAIRERASHRLRQLDERVVPFLEVASQSNSPEVRMRATSLLKLLRVDRSKYWERNRRTVIRGCGLGATGQVG